MKLNARRRAFELLCQLMKRRQPLVFAATDTALTKALCFGVCRHYYQLESTLDSMVSKRPGAIEVWIALMLGLYQLKALNKPPYAVVQETVGLLSHPQLNYAKGFVNALLRRFCREYAAKLGKGIEQAENGPTWLLEQLKADWKGNWHTIVQANTVHPPLILRVNAQQTTRDAYLKRLEKAGIVASGVSALDTTLILASPVEVTTLPGWTKGEVSVQDISAQLVLPLMDLKPNLRVLDACAAPGGKLCHILETEPQLKFCLAIDRDAARLERVKENLHRLHLKAEVKCADASRPKEWWDGKVFDRILVDAPCSGTGVIRRHPDIQILREPQEVETVARVQAQLLNALWPLLSKGGRLVYATCSVLRQENDKQISAFLGRTPDAVNFSFSLPWGRPCDSGWQIFPGEGEGDGFYYAVLEKRML